MKPAPMDHHNKRQSRRIAFCFAIGESNPSLKRSFKKVIDKIIVKLKKLCNEIKAVYGARNEYAEELESSINDLEDIRRQWEKAVKQGVKNQNTKQAVKEKSSDTGVQELARVARKNSFDKALTKAEWASFYSSLTKNNQRDYFRVNENGILIPDANNSYKYKLVYYDYINQSVEAVYILENYDYNIHSDIIDAAQFIIQFQKEVSLGEEHATAVLENISNMYGTIFKRYRPSSRRFIKLTRKSNSGRANSQNESDRGRASAKTQQYQDRKAEQIDRVYLAAVENGDTETAQRMVDEAAKAAGYTPKMMYHGSPNFFTTFDKKRARYSGYYGKGFYFSEPTLKVSQLK